MMCCAEQQLDEVAASRKEVQEQLQAAHADVASNHERSKLLEKQVTRLVCSWLLDAVFRHIKVKTNQLEDSASLSACVSAAESRYWLPAWQNEMSVLTTRHDVTRSLSQQCCLTCCSCMSQAAKPKYTVVHQKQTVIHDVIERSRSADTEQVPTTVIATSKAWAEGQPQLALQAEATATESTPRAVPDGNNINQPQPSRFNKVFQSVMRPFSRSHVFSPSGTRSAFAPCILVTCHSLLLSRVRDSVLTRAE